MTEYAKQKNAELEQLLKDRGLPHTGKKADLVSRLEADDKEKAAASKAPADATTAAAIKEDEIDWDDEAAAEAPKTNAPSASVAKPSVAQTVSEAPLASTDDAASATIGQGKPAEISQGDISAVEASETKPAQNFSIGLQAATVDEEIEKRKARAKKFGMTENDPLADEALQRLERAKKFGDADGPRGLNEALPDRRPKRGRDDGNEGGRDFKRRGRGGRRFNDRGGRPARGGGDHSGSSYKLSEKDRAAAEARKARFAS